MDELNTNFLRDERNWFFQEKFPTRKIMESAVWPAKITHRHQVIIPQQTFVVTFRSIIVYHRSMKLQYEKVNYNDNYPQVSLH